MTIDLEPSNLREFFNVPLNTKFAVPNNVRASYAIAEFHLRWCRSREPFFQAIEYHYFAGGLNAHSYLSPLYCNRE